MTRSAEAQITASIVSWLRTVLPRGSVVHHARNEIDIAGKDAARQIAKAKWMGMLPGFPDLVIAVSGGPVLFLEVKKKGGRLSETQEAVAGDLRDGGHYWHLVRSIDEARNVLALHCVETREAQ